MEAGSESELIVADQFAVLFRQKGRHAFGCPAAPLARRRARTLTMARDGRLP
ncbi:hypothetical protein NITMOv2_2859 [Nitrospira moscoviensis]|uniref:Uncharacterized protein n=1 Tax=Nitrospira moscoviensis TaxID=42253 RepID=A0A0K2GE78_NITMO|nr:hypothetical protein NITMOv2_2859 [Nitrospira moscoviensis]